MQAQEQAQFYSDIPLKLFNEWVRSEDWLTYITIEDAAGRFLDSYAGQFNSLYDWAKQDLKKRYPGFFNRGLKAYFVDLFCEQHAKQALGELIWCIELDGELHIFNMDY
jgi:hypothetical protein